MSEFNAAQDSQAYNYSLPSQGLGATDSSTSMSGMTQAQKMQMAQLASQMLMKGFSTPATKMGGPMTAPQGTATQAPNAGQFINPQGAR